ncbi:Vacuolar sorting protein VPS45/Stt10 (Sec1 family) [Pseudoloma neurophilia]|uniref:Vacuolar sorting protein VPS45/Stt10 (Sec1 family) n=1 Tax=Pseudoloma neurophilia TaxID=146866 RepID=A0A0R0M0F9_9MICR|nr:Vacuolar sorting protein VPS45/Stt10 (Sec1 family) [Pseudoloma neurophilia]
MNTTTNHSNEKYSNQNENTTTIDPFSNKIHAILNNTPGNKVVLFDDHSKKVIASLIPQSMFLMNDHFLFYMLNDKRKKIEGVTGVVFLKRDSTLSLINELQKPTYERYVIYFIDTLPYDLLEMVAKNDIHSVIEKVYEIDMDIVLLHDRIYIHNGLDIDFSINVTETGNESLDIKDIRNESDLQTGNVSLETKKDIHTGNVSDLHTGNVSLETKTKYTSCSLINSLNRPYTVLTYKRELDPFTPLLYEWRYHSMIYEYFNLKSNSLIQLDNKIYDYKDTFYDHNKYKDINQVSKSLKEYIHSTQTSSINKSSSLNTTLDQDALSQTVNTTVNITESVKQRDSAEIHLKIHNHIVRECIGNKDTSELEYRILQGDKISYKDIVGHIISTSNLNGEQPSLGLLKDPSLSLKCHSDNVKIAKLVIIYLLKYPSKINRPFFKEYLNNNLKVKQYINTITQSNKIQSNKIQSDKLFRNESDIKLAYEPYIKTFLLNQIKKKYNKKKVLIIKIDHCTMSETRVIDQVCKEYGIEYFILIDRMITYKDIIGDLLSII